MLKCKNWLTYGKLYAEETSVGKNGNSNERDRFQDIHPQQKPPQP